MLGREDQKIEIVICEENVLEKASFRATSRSYIEGILQVPRCAYESEWRECAKRKKSLNGGEMSKKGIDSD